MKKWIERNYGADADGNRGIDLHMAELEPSDDPEVKALLIKHLGEDTSEWPETYTITIDDYDFEVDTRDYT